MKRLIIFIILLYAAVAGSQSVLTYGTGTSIGVLTGADLCANIKYGSGILYGGGTFCGGSIYVKTLSTEIPDRFDLQQNYPNPFNPVTVIKYQLPKIVFISLKVYDQLGKEVEVIYEGRQEPGYYEATLDGSGLASGIYFCRIYAGDFVKVIVLSLVK
ncbi:MAG: T9SS type A sorting domain-containing protein [Ignavibacteria bacterium]|nr:T9SS type A sorting domain-containing protein [Ignavibacteria bacterium]